MLFLVPAFLLFAADDLESSFKRLMDVYAIAEEQAADPVDANRAFYEGAIPGMLRKLDPHSIFFDPGQFQQLQELEKSTRKGFGTVVSVLPGRVIILQTLPNTPSTRAGLEPGDEILAVNNIALGGLTMEQLIGLLGQTRQSQAKLDVKRQGNARLLQFLLTPADVDSPPVDRAFLLQDGVGYVRVTSFDQKAGEQVKAAIEKLGGASLKGLVLDLRDNPGGLMPAGLETASLFLKPGQQIVSVKGRRIEGQQEIKVPDNSAPYAFPLAVLVNAKSASASEIVAGAIQDHDRGIIVGQKSFGKGLVQSVYPLSSDTGLALTTAFYYTPSGRSIQRPLSGTQLEAASTAAGPTAHTDRGRSVEGGGGIRPDFEAFPQQHSQLMEVLDGTGSFPSFATEFLRKHRDVTDRFEATPAVLGEFQGFLVDKGFAPPVSQWSADREWIRSRLQQEILNQAIGVEKGDEIELRRDPVVKRALQELGL